MLNQLNNTINGFSINASAGRFVDDTMNTINFFPINEVPINYGVLPVQDFGVYIASDVNVGTNSGVTRWLGTAVESTVEIQAPSVDWGADDWVVSIVANSAVSGYSHVKYDTDVQISSYSELEYRDVIGGDAAFRADAIAEMQPTGGIRWEAGTIIESNDEMIINNRDAMEICTFIESEVETYVQDYNFGSIDITTKFSLLPAGITRKWINPELHPEAQVYSGGLINPVIYKHGTEICPKLDFYTDAEVIGRWLFVENTSKFDIQGVRRRHGDTVSETIMRMFSDGEVIGRWWWSDNTTEMDGGIAGNIINSPVTMIDEVAIKTSGSVMGKLATKLSRDVEMKGSALIYVDGGIKVSEHKTCPVFI